MHFDQSIRSLLEPRSMYGGVGWRLTRVGLIVGSSLPRTAGKLVTVPRVWDQFGRFIADSATRLRVPLELIVATICTESGGVPTAVRQEPGWDGDEATPRKISAGLMQTLLSTARGELPGHPITREALFDPGLSIEAGTSCIRKQFTRTLFDPPLVACSYNAGSLYKNTDNRWHLGQYGNHADRFVEFFNDCMAFFAEAPAEMPPQAPSFTGVFTGKAP
jgi:soluble lytic murein transglycosylase-like protein